MAVWRPIGAVEGTVRVLGIGGVHVSMSALLGWIAASSVLAPGPTVGAIVGAAMGLLTVAPVAACIWKRNLAVSALCLYAPTLCAAFASLAISHLGIRLTIVLAALQVGLVLVLVFAPRVR